MDTKVGFLLLLSVGSCIAADLHIDELLTGGKCGAYSRIPGGVVKSHQQDLDSPSATIMNDFTCFFTIQAVKFRQRIRLFFSQFSLSGNDCASTHVKIYDGKTKDASLIKTICPGDKIENKEFNSSSYLMTLELKMTEVNDEAPQVNFNGYYASYSVPRPNSQSCIDSERERMCANGRCVYKELFCDGYDSCGDGSDELTGDCSSESDEEDSAPAGEPEKSCGDIQYQRWLDYFEDWIEEYLRWKNNRRF